MAELKKRVPGSRDPVQHTDKLYSRWLLSEDPEEKKALQKEINSMKKKFDLVRLLDFEGSLPRSKGHYFTTREKYKEISQQKYRKRLKRKTK